jgi:transposase InsO family protein
MPWKECDAVSERMHFVSRLLNEEKMADLCREFKISRKTGYKIFNRYKNEGLDGLKDQCRKPKKRPNQTSSVVTDLILDLRKDHSTWGAPKIKSYLEARHKKSLIPACSTIHVILKRHDLVVSKKRRTTYRSTGTDLEEVTDPNQLWCTDFKGQFRMGNASYCYPLTITDQFSRFLIECEGMSRISEVECLRVFEDIFCEYGIPDAIRSDNGVPFASRSFFGISKLSLFWARQGIRIERTQPGCPQQNGRHERMHRTLKAETTKPVGSNLLTQQEKFEIFKDLFNNERPHQALKMKPPASQYKKSKKKFIPIGPLEYPGFDQTCRVRTDGTILLPNQKRLYVGEVFNEENLGIKKVEEDVWGLNFMNYELAFFNLHDPILEIVANPFLIKSLKPSNKVSPMSPE